MSSFFFAKISYSIMKKLLVTEYKPRNGVMVARQPKG